MSHIPFTKRVLLASLPILSVSCLWAETTFVNPIYASQDPWIIKGPDGFYYSVTETPGTKSVDIYKSKSLTDRGARRTAYKADANGPRSSGLWAPELHYVDGGWYIYTCSDDGNNVNHRAIVLKSDTNDPFGSYSYAGTLDTGAWAIDATVFKADNGKLYCVWSGWPDGAAPDSTQRLFLSEMSSPTKLTGKIVDISGKMLPWETVGRPGGLNEGPQVLQKNGKVFVIYSASGSWTPDYCFGQLTYSGGDILDAKNWVKSEKPVFSRAGNVYGPGHGSFTKSPDGKEDWMVYHSSIDANGSWNRSISAKKFTWNADGTPNFGTPVQWGESLSVPSGEEPNKPGTAFKEDFSGNDDHWQKFNFVREQAISLQDGALDIDATKDDRFGDKALVRDADYSNFELESDIKILKGAVDGDLIFRVNEPAIGIDSFKGYVAAINVNGYVELGRSDGKKFTSLSKVDLPVNKDQSYRLKVVADGDHVQVYVDGEKKIDLTDSTYSNGQVGVRAVTSNVRFDNFEVRPLAAQ
jgi:GH43 family beta-xylosidase